MVVDPDLEEREWYAVIIKWRACFVQKSIIMEERACEFRQILIDDQESLSSVFPLQFFPSSQTENKTMLKLCQENIHYVFFAFVAQKEKRCTGQSKQMPLGIN